MNFYFYPADEACFKEAALGKYVRTLVYNQESNLVELTFTRKVSTIWSQTVKNNIESDHRIKALLGEKYEIYNWVVVNEKEFSLPEFKKHL